MSVTIQFNGFDQKFFDDITYEASEILAVKIVAQAKTLAPVDKGRLRNGVMLKTVKKELGFNDSPGEKAENQISITPSGFDSYVGINVTYAGWVEFGTKKMPSQPFLRPAIDIYAHNRGRDDVMKAIRYASDKAAFKKGERRVYN